MRIPDPVRGFTRIPDPVFFLIALSTPVFFLIALSTPVFFLIALRTRLICVLLMSISTPVLFLIARSIFLICLAVKCKVSLPPVIASFLNLSVTASPRPKARARLTFCPSVSEILCG